MSKSRCQAKNRSTCRKHGLSALSEVSTKLSWETAVLPSALEELKEVDSMGNPTEAYSDRVDGLRRRIRERLTVIRDGAPEFVDMLSDYETHGEYVKALGVDPDSSDDTGFNSKYVYCGSHRRGHTTGWCTVHNRNKVPLAALGDREAADECRKAGFSLYEDDKR